MANLTITNNDQGSVVIEEKSSRDVVIAFAGADTLVEGTIIARREVVTAITPAANAGNTGNGTVTAAAVVAGPTPSVGSYNLELVDAAVQSGTATATASAVTGTGTGTVTAVTVDAGAAGLKPGAYPLTCLELGVKAGTATAAASAVTGTGDGVIGAVTAGAKAKAGAYTLTCITAVANAGVFSVVSPSGVRLADLTVAVAYSNQHFGVTVADGANDFVVGDYFTITISNSGGVWKLEDPDGSMLSDSIYQSAGAGVATAVQVAGLNFTITDGATDFAVGDVFTITVANTTGRWKLEDPNGALVADNIVTAAGAGTATVVEVPGMTFTITDGSADFVAGDKFSLPVVADGDCIPYAVAGLGGSQEPIGVLPYEIVAAGAVDVAARIISTGSFRKQRLVVDLAGDDSTLTAAILDDFFARGIEAIDTPSESVLDNQ